MYKYSETSKKRLKTVTHELRIVFNLLIKHYDCTIVYGQRGEKAQNELFKNGLSKLKYPNSKHNRKPFSEAVDAAPWIDGKASEDYLQCTYMAGLVIGIGKSFGFNIRWGGNWDQDLIVIEDQTFQDLWHYEIIINDNHKKMDFSF